MKDSDILRTLQSEYDKTGWVIEKKFESSEGFGRMCSTIGKIVRVETDPTDKVVIRLNDGVSVRAYSLEEISENYLNR